MKHSFFQYFKNFIVLFFGCFLAAFAVVALLTPANLIDGGVVGLSMITSSIIGKSYLPYCLIIFNLPFMFFAQKIIGKNFIVKMFISVIMFAACCFVLNKLNIKIGNGILDTMEIIVISGVILGAGVGIIIKNGASLDGTEILAIIINKAIGTPVGKMILTANVIIFSLSAFIFKNIHVAFQSLLVYLIAIKIIDTVIVGSEETKSVLIISKKSQEVTKKIINDMGLGLTVMYGRGGFSGKSREILYVIVERLQLAELKSTVFEIDNEAFISIENIHEVKNARAKAPSRETKTNFIKNRIKSLIHSEKR